MTQTPFTYMILVALARPLWAQDYDYTASIRPTGHALPKPTPIPILKQINRHNEDGSYTYGYEGADGSFKIETKLSTGEVKGKYGYVDDTGKVRIVEYGATNLGFQPAGDGITVPPPTLIDETTHREVASTRAPPPQPPPEDGIQYYEPVVPRIRQPQQYLQAVVPAPPQVVNYVPLRGRVQYLVGAAPPSSPAPVQEDNTSYENDGITAGVATVTPHPRITYARPQQLVPAPQAHPQPQQLVVVPSRGHGGGILDQLSREYALPQGGAAPLHDISFGYY